MKKILSVLVSNKCPVLNSTSHEKYWSTGDGLDKNGEDEKKSRRRDLCYEKTLKKMRQFNLLKLTETILALKYAGNSQI